MTRDLGAHPVALSRLLDGVADGVVLLPEFQRTFDWSDSDVRSLLATALMSWPAGSLLLMSGEPDFALRPLESAPSRALRVEYVVLDGQQRLTSLFHALRGFGEDVWILDVSKLADDVGSISVDDLEEALSSIPRVDWETEYPLRRQALERLVPLHSLESPADYFEWRDAVTEEAPADTRKMLRRQLTSLYKDLLSRVHEYSFPAVILQSELPVEAIARIFERINRTGLRLTTFDLMVARTYRQGWNLREEWERAKGDFPALADFTEDGLPALQVLSLTTARDIRQPAVLQSDPELVRAGFAWACEALATGYDWLMSRCGVRDRGWMPYGVMPVVIGALAGEGSLQSRTPDVERWFWLSILSQRFDVASSTQAAADFAAFVEGRDVSVPSLRDAVFTVAGAPLLEATKRKVGAVWRGFACALGTEELLDLRSGDSLLDPDTGLLAQRVSFGSVFARGDAIPGRSPYHLRVLAQFIGHPTSVRALAGSPSQWTADDLDEAALASQLLPSRSEFRRLLVDPEAFVTWRLGAFGRFVEARVGVEVDTV
jgi:hypothetical protein